MRYQHIEQRIEQQYDIRRIIQDFVPGLADIEAENNSIRIQTRLEFLKEHWEEFKLNHRAISIAVSALNEEEKTRIQQRRYFQRNHFQSTRSTYESSVEKANTLVAPNASFLNTMPRRESSAGRSSMSRDSNRVIHHAPRLPQLDFPKFNGSVLNWLPFRATFEKMVVKNDAVDVVYKAHYLKSAMIGSAAHFLNSTTLTEDNFHLVWEQLTKFYHNERVLLQSALHAAATMRKMRKESASELEQLYSTVNQIRNSLELLKRSMPGLDDQLVYATTQRFDPETLKAWELHLGATQTPPVWTQLSSFIMARLLTLKSYEHSSNPKSAASTSTSSSGVKVHHSEEKTDKKFYGKPPTPCVLCTEQHYLSRCPVFAGKTTEKRIEVVNQHDLCYNCLGKHRANACFSTRRCLKCGKKHHTSIHRYSAKPTIEAAPASAPTIHTNHASEAHSSCIFLATAKLVITSANGERTHVRALIDQGSEASLITERVVQQLKLPRESTSTHIVGIGGHSSNRTRGIVLFKVHSHFDFTKSLCIRAHILPKLTSSLPSTSQSAKKWPHLQGLKLADPDFFTTGPIDVILGADVYGQLIEEGVVKDGPLMPTAQLTKFGWIISGPSGNNEGTAIVRTFHLNIDLDLNKQLQRFWTLDEVPNISNARITKAEEECENHFLKTHSRDKDGRYIVRLPFKASPSQLGDSKPKALRMLYCLQKKFSSNPSFKKKYTEFIQEYEKLQHLVPVSPSSPEPELAYYLPHHGVLKESSFTTKLRVVFNGSSATSSGKSLNDLLNSGRKLQTDLFNVLLFFRLHRYVFSGDIEKFYRQIKVHPDDWKFQRILWYVGNQLTTYELTTDTYGLACAAFLALRAFQQLLGDDGSKYPLALQALTRGRYVDDIVGGADTIDEAKAQIDQIINLCMAGGFPIQKWNSNHPDTLSNVPQEKRLEALSKAMDESSTIPALGLMWQPKTDTFHFTIKLSADPPITKRKILPPLHRSSTRLDLLLP